MASVRHLRGNFNNIPEEKVDGSIYVDKTTGSVKMDIGQTRVSLNPPADYNETNQNSPAYIANKPSLGTVAEKNVAQGIDLTTDIPTSRQVYNMKQELEADNATIRAFAYAPLRAAGIAAMTDTTKVYIYTGDEEGMLNGHYYYYNGSAWTDGGVFNASVVDTDTSLLVQNKAADAYATGQRFVQVLSDIEDMRVTINDHINAIAELENRADSFFDGLEVTDTGMVWGIQNGARLDGPYGPFAGNGGGGGTGGGDTIDAEFSATNLTEWTGMTISDGDDANFSFTWESLEGGSASGRGTVTITVNNIVKATLSVPQGENTINLKNYYGVGNNKIRIRIADQYDQGKSWIVNLNAVSLTISSTFSTSTPFETAITFPYTPVGTVTKTVYFVIDKDQAGETTYTTVTSASGKQQSFSFPAQSHGAHTLHVYFTAEINSETVRSNTLFYEFISIEDGETDTILVSPFTATNQTQYSSVVIPYSAYDPAGLETVVTIYVDDVLAATQTVDRSEHSFTYKANRAGNVEIKFVCHNTVKTIDLVIAESDVSIQAETEALSLYLTANGRSNADENKTVWSYTDANSQTITAQMQNFNWQLDGWMNDDDGVNVLRTLGDARVYIPFKPFIKNFSSTGQTFEIEFSTHNVVDYNTPIISCMANNIGFVVTPQTVTFKSAQRELMTPFKENEHIRITIVVHKQVADRLILFYVNGIMSSALQYPSGENFRQGNESTAVGITIGSNDCGVDIYNLRIYDNDLSREQVISNWIADTQSGDLMLDRFNRNNIFDNGVINPNTLPSNLPYFIINATEMPQYKGDKKTVSLSFTDPVSPAKSFTAEGVQINVQGTSSQAYYRKNYDLQFKKGFNLASGHSDTYVINDAMPFNRFVLKADVASSESTNNTRLVMFYNDTCPYKIPEMLTNDKVRWGIEGRPCVLFWYNPDTGVTEFLGRYDLAQVKLSLIYGETLIGQTTPRKYDLQSIFIILYLFYIILILILKYFQFLFYFERRFYDCHII